MNTRDISALEEFRPSQPAGVFRGPQHVRAPTAIANTEHSFGCVHVAARAPTRSDRCAKPDQGSRSSLQSPSRGTRAYSLFGGNLLNGIRRANRKHCPSSNALRLWLILSAPVVQKSATHPQSSRVATLLSLHHQMVTPGHEESVAV